MTMASLMVPPRSLCPSSLENPASLTFPYQIEKPNLVKFFIVLTMDTTGRAWSLVFFFFAEDEDSPGS